MRNADGLALEIVGATIAGLSKVGSRTKVIVMDNKASGVWDEKWCKN